MKISATTIKLTMAASAVLALGFILAPLRWASDNPVFNTEICYRCAVCAPKAPVVGRDGWLFYKNSLLSIVLPWPHDNLDRIVAFRDSLALQGMTLLVVPVPGKEMVYPGKVSASEPGVVCRQYQRLVDGLRSSGVHVVDMLPLLRKHAITGDSVFGPSETHLTDRGTLVAAGVISEAILDLLPEMRDTARYFVKDTIALMPFDLARLKSGDVDSTARRPTRRSSVRQADGSLLRDDPSSPILIFGDSNVWCASEVSAGISSQIARLLGRGTRIIGWLRACNRAPEFFASHKDSLKSSVNVVVWVFASRSLAQPIAPYRNSSRQE